MASTGSEFVRKALASYRARRREYATFAFVAVMVTVCVALGLHQRGIAATRTERVLDCHYAGTGAHTHDSSCYDADGNLVCPLQEREYHVHTDACYAERRELACGMGEHQHGEGCYDEEGNLICDVAEHAHTDACYDVTRELACGKEEAAETHTHGPGCFREVTVDDGSDETETLEAQSAPEESVQAATEGASFEDASTMPAQTFAGELKERDAEGNERVILAINVKAPEGALPAGSQLVMKAIEGDELEATTAYIDEAVRKADEDATGISWMQAVGFSFADAGGNEVRPQKKVELKVTHDRIRDIEDPVLARTLDAEAKAEFGRDDDAEVLDSAALTNLLDEDTSTGNEDTLTLQTKVPGTYAVVEVAHEDEAAAEVQDGGDEDPEVTMPAQSLSAEVGDMTVTVEAPEGAFPEGVQLAAASVEPDEVRAQVEGVVDSQSEQVADIAAVDIAFTDAEGNTIEPAVPVSVGLTSDVVLDAEHPVLVQMGDEPLVVEEAETVNSQSETMIGAEDTLRFEGEGSGTYVVAALETITTKVITASGKTYEISVTYGPDAGIPDGAELQVREILEGEKAYSDNVKATNKVLQKQEEPEVTNPAQFDISIVFEGQEIEPNEGSVVNVEIKLAPEVFENGSDKDGQGSEGEPEGEIWYNGVNYAAEDAVSDSGQDEATRYTVAHITDDGKAELIDAADSVDEKDNIVLEFETDSFSDYLFDESNNVWNLPSTIYVGDEIYMYNKADYWVSNIDSIVTETKHPNGNNGNDGSKWKTVTAISPRTFKIYNRYNENNEYKVITVLPARTGTQTPGTIDTIDNASIGLTLNLFDYDLDNYLDDYFNNFNHTDNPVSQNFLNRSGSINNGHALKFWGSGIGDNYGSANKYDAHLVHSIIQTDLAGGIGGYPKLARNSNPDASQESLEYLFSPSDGTDKEAYTNVNHLFKKVGDYYVYDSNQNYAYYDKTQGNGGSFQVYDGTYNQKTRDSGGEQASHTDDKKIGFFPFHKWDDDYDLYVNWNKNLNHHFGMSMSVDFNMPQAPKAVKDTDGNDIIFEFSGDDDLWVFIDGKLAMDIGGIHQPTSGTINFTTGVVEVNDGIQLNKDQFTQRFPNLYDGNKHTLQVFYIERGGCDSNCMIKFNLTRYGHVEFDKADKDNPNDKLAGAIFGIYKDSNCTQPLMEQLDAAHNNMSRAYIAESDANGHVKFSDIPLGTYYLKELSAPEGYPLDNTVHTVNVYLDQTTGQVKVSVTIDGTNVEDGVVIFNKKPAPINLGLKKEWQNADGQAITAPTGVSSTFEIKRIRTYETYTETQVEGHGENVSHLTVGWIHNGETHIYKEYDLISGSQATVSWSYADGYEGSKDCVLNGSRVDKDYVTGNVVSEAITMPPAGQSTTFYIVDDSETGEAIRNINVVGRQFYGNSGGGVIHEFTTVAEPDSSFSYTDAENSQLVTNNQITLPIDQTTWQYTFANLPTFGTGTVTIEGQPRDVAFNYSYYLEEVRSTAPEGTTVVYKDLNGNVVNTPTGAETSVSGTETITNKVPTGYLRIDKAVTYNGISPVPEGKTSDLAGDYTFKVYTDADCSKPYKVIQGEAPNQQEVDLVLTVTIGPDGVAKSSNTVKLPVGDYWIEEQTPIQTGVTPDVNRIKVPVAADQTTDEPGIASFTNNKEESDNPDELAIELEKTFTGLHNASEIPGNFQATLTYTYNNETVTILLTGSTQGNVTCVKSNNDMTWHWRITQIPKTATNFAVYESNYNIDGYTRITKINGQVVQNPSNPESVNVLVPEITMTNITRDYTTTDKNKVFTVVDNQILLVRMTSQATVIVSPKSLSLATRQAIEKMIDDNDGKIPGDDGAQAQWVNKYLYFSREIQGDTFSYGGRTIFFEGNLVKIPHNASSHEVRVDIGYTSTSAENSFTLENNYTEVPTQIDVLKVEKGKETTSQLSGAVFELRKLEDVAPTAPGGTLTYVKDANQQEIVTSKTTGNNGKLTFDNLTYGEYEIREVTPPPGYIQEENVTIYLRVSGGKITYLQKGSNKPSEWSKAPESESGATVYYTEAEPGTGNDTFRVGNTPGEELPSAGGVGTMPLRIAGLMLIGLAAVVLKRRWSVAQ